jgi:hypothetical protein
MTSATLRHWEQAKRVLRYLSGTLNLGITYNGQLSPEILMWQDSSFDDGDARRSRTGFVAMMCGSVITWGSKLQPTVALSTVEAEYMALSASAQEVAFLRQLLVTLGEPLTGPTPMFEDNKGADSLANNKMTTFKSKHIDIRHHFVRDLVTANVLSIVWIGSAEMIADILTKNTLPAALHQKHTDMMLSGTYSGP